MAPIVHIAFLPFADQGISATRAFHKSSEQEVIEIHSRAYATVQDILHSVELRLGDQRLMIAKIRFARRDDAHHSRVKGIPENGMQSISRDVTPCMITEPLAIHFVHECGDAPLCGAVELERLPNERTFCRIDRLRFA